MGAKVKHRPIQTMFNHQRYNLLKTLSTKLGTIPLKNGTKIIKILIIGIGMDCYMSATGTKWTYTYNILTPEVQPVINSQYQI